MEAGRTEPFVIRRLTVTNLGPRGPLGTTLPTCTRCLAAATAGTSMSRRLATSNDHDADQRSDLLNPGHRYNMGAGHPATVARRISKRPVLIAVLLLAA